MAIYPIEIASHTFAMTSINSRRLNATWYEAFGRRIYAEAMFRNLERAKKVCAIGDGPPWFF